jgi:conjugal transfer mating pair stabilization protein TraN
MYLSVTHLRLSIIIVLFCFITNFAFSSAIQANLSNTQDHGFTEEECKLTQTKYCVDYSERIVDGFPTTQCWKYEQKFICASREINHCQIFEDNRGCTEVSGTCLQTTPVGSCKIFKKTFVCGNHLETKFETKHIGTDFNIIRDEKDFSTCSEQDKNKYCEQAQETCVEGPETRNISGKDIYKDCWRWDRKYVCRTNSFIDECKDLKSNCKEVSKECLHRSDKTGECEHFEVKYECSDTTTKTKDCISSQFCIGDICKSSERSKHNDFGSISYLSILASMKSTELEGCKCPDGRTECNPGELDTSSCRFFTGQGNKCRHHTGEFNCCSEKGFLTDILKCSQSEKDLLQKRTFKLCHHVGSWRGKKLEFYKKWQSHCCFKSKIAKILQVSAREQLGVGWGDIKKPDCRALTLSEIQKVDFSKIDFSDLYSEMEEKAKASIDSKKDGMKSKLENLKGNSDLINKKINNFYKQNKENK